MSIMPNLANVGRTKLAKCYGKTGTLGPNSKEVPVTEKDIEQANHYADLADRMDSKKGGPNDFGDGFRHVTLLNKEQIHAGTRGGMEDLGTVSPLLEGTKQVNAELTQSVDQETQSPKTRGDFSIVKDDGGETTALLRVGDGSARLLTVSTNGMEGNDQFEAILLDFPKDGSPKKTTTSGSLLDLQGFVLGPQP
jgi:hypothetical protein